MCRRCKDENPDFGLGRGGKNWMKMHGMQTRDDDGRDVYIEFVNTLRVVCTR